MTTSLGSIQLFRFLVPRHGDVPNTSISNIPLLIYKNAFASGKSSSSTSAIEKHIRANEWDPQWRYSMYTTSHFHSTTHEALVVIQGAAKLCFGGDENPDKQLVDVEAGDSIFVPAGLAHRLWEETGSASFKMIGSYPRGAEQWDMCYGNEGEYSVLERRIAALGKPATDPFYGKSGPAVKNEA